MVVPPIFDYFERDPLEVRFVYPSPDRPQLDTTGFLALYLILVITQQISFVLAIILGFAVLKKQAWAWFMSLGLYGLVVITITPAIIFLWPYASTSRIAILLISAACLCLLSRKDVRNYLKPPRNS